MNEDKLNEKAWEYSDSMREDETTKNDDMATAHYKGFKAGALWHESLPLAERLSESEKENIRNEYKKAYSEAFAETTCLDRQYARGRYQVLREIFGKNLFTPTEQ